MGWLYQFYITDRKDDAEKKKSKKGGLKSDRAGIRTMESVQRFIEGKLRLKVNEKKSAVDRPWNRKFLAFSFTSHKEPKVRIAKTSLQRMKKKIRANQEQH